jgi:hypothetical protein
MMMLWELLRSDLHHPEYVHVLLNPLPVYGLAVATLGLIVGLLMRQRAAQCVGLLLVAITAGSAWPVIEYGEHGYDRVTAMSNRDARQWLDVHAHRAGVVEPVFYVTAGLALAGLLFLWKIPAHAAKAVLVVLLAALVTLGAGAWVGQAGGQVRHSEFREGPPPGTPVGRGTPR